MKTSFLRLLTTGFLSLTWIGADIAGAVTISLSDEAPPEGRSLVRVAVAEGQLGTAYMMRYYREPFREVNYHREVGQSFVVPGEAPVSVEGFALRIASESEVGAGGLEVVFSIYKTTSNGIPDGPPIYESTGGIPDGVTKLSYITFLLDDAVVLEDGGRYSFKVGYKTSTGEKLRFAASRRDVYAQGRSFYYANSDEQRLSEMIYTPANRDLDFTVLYSPEGGR